MIEAVRGLASSLVILAALIAPASSEGLLAMNSTPDIKDAKKALDFKSWPGKNGTLKPGLKFVPSSVPSLAGFLTKKDTRREAKVDNASSLLRILTLANGSDNIRIEIQVCPASTDDAQEALIATLAATDAGTNLLVRGDQHGISVGDLNFVRKPGPPQVGFLHFVRNNVRVYVSRPPDSTFDVVALATAIDGQIVAGADFTKATIKSQIPVITTFAPQSSTIPPLSETPITLVASDPQGRKLEFEFSGNLGQIKRDDSVSPPKITFASDDKLGQAQIRLLMINENLLFATASTTVTIQ